MSTTLATPMALPWAMAMSILGKTDPFPPSLPQAPTPTPARTCRTYPSLFSSAAKLPKNYPFQTMPKTRENVKNEKPKMPPGKWDPHPIP